ncbi:OLC1v1017837C2 [Oldenlandia corymbosa var. corymbosa]|uniref:OLC1v1017837C2 n=1 Tax=Oldenlandia corymbosa var. corymbosa TaxID=529605 RepID=A0AAV1EA97_OLDCO|nr:OLC1v1017837C2 [Oldenlandia corymbosa var. corymbosa]
MATARMLNRGGCVSSSTYKSNGFSELRSSMLKVRCISNNNGGSGENWLPCTNNHANKVEKKNGVSPVEVKASTSGCVIITSTPTKSDRLAELAGLLGDAAGLFFAFIRRLSLVIKSIPWIWHLQMFMEKVIVDCRFFTMLAVGGTLLGSLLCFVEGCVLIIESYVKYFHSMSQGSAQEHLVHLLIEAIATAMLVFATGLHVMFVGSSSGFRGKGSQIFLQPNFIKTLPSRVGIHTVMQAKSKIGQAVIMILQVGMLEKFKTIPLVTSLDFACFAAAVFASSACTFLLSKLAIRR